MSCPCTMSLLVKLLTLEYLRWWTCSELYRMVLAACEMYFSFLSRLFPLTGPNRETIPMVMNVGCVLWPKEYTLIAYILHDTPAGLSCRYRCSIVTKYIIPLWLSDWVTLRFLGFRASVVTGCLWLRYSLVCDKVIHGFPGSLDFHAYVDQRFTTCMSRNPPSGGLISVFPQIYVDSQQVLVLQLALGFLYCAC